MCLRNSKTSRTHSWWSLECVFCIFLFLTNTCTAFGGSWNQQRTFAIALQRPPALICSDQSLYVCSEHSLLCPASIRFISALVLMCTFATCAYIAQVLLFSDNVLMIAASIVLHVLWCCNCSSALWMPTVDKRRKRALASDEADGEEFASVSKSQQTGFEETDGNLAHESRAGVA